MVTPANALKWSMWLASQHPQAFAAVAARVIPRTQRVRTPGFGHAPAQPAAQRARMRPFARGRFGAFGQSDSTDLPEVTVESSGYDPNAVRTDAFTQDSSTLSEFTPTVAPIAQDTLSDPALQDINVSVPGDVNFNLGAAANASDTSGGFWSSVGSGLSSIGSGLASAVGAVAGAVTNPQVLASAGNLAANVIKAQNTPTAAQQQLALLQAQQARTLSGVGAAPLTYQVNPLTGQRTAYVYNPSTGQYAPVAAGIGGAISLPGSLNTYLPYLIVGGIVFVLLLARRS